MSPLFIRRLVAVQVDMAVFWILFVIGEAGLWAFIIFPHACWCFYDGITRLDLEG